LGILQSWGWRDGFEKPDKGEPGRVIEEQRGLYTVVLHDGELKCDLPGRMRHRVASTADLPTVGDWVAVRPRRKEGTGTIVSVLPRLTYVSRRASGEKDEEQVVAANVDIVFVTTSLNADFNARRLERYLAMVRQGGAEPVVLLTKSDLCKDVGAVIAETRKSSGSALVIAISVRTPGGLAPFEALLKPGRTHVLVGSSGVGKSTIVNALAGSEVMATGEVREHDDRGKHTTSHRQLFKMPNGALIIDTPGLREVQLWDAEEGLKETFDDITALLGSCKYDNCKHETEPGCAVRAAVGEGKITPERHKAFLKLQKELPSNIPEWQKRRKARIGAKLLRDRLKDKRPPA
jgi:ribosome biogenesis GTPase